MSAFSQMQAFRDNALAELVSKDAEIRKLQEKIEVLEAQIANLQCMLGHGDD